MKKILPSLLISIPKGIIDLGWGHPSTNLHPVEYLNIAAKKVLSEDSTALQYGAMQGYGPLLESLSIFLSKVISSVCILSTLIENKPPTSDSPWVLVPITLNSTIFFNYTFKLS